MAHFFKWLMHDATLAGLLIHGVSIGFAADFIGNVIDHEWFWAVVCLSAMITAQWHYWRDWRHKLRA